MVKIKLKNIKFLKNIKKLPKIKDNKKPMVCYVFTSLNNEDTSKHKIKCLQNKK